MNNREKAYSALVGLETVMTIRQAVRTYRRHQDRKMRLKRLEANHQETLRQVDTIMKNARDDVKSSIAKINVPVAKLPMSAEDQQIIDKFYARYGK